MPDYTITVQWIVRDAIDAAHAADEAAADMSFAAVDDLADAIVSVFPVPGARPAGHHQTMTEQRSSTR